MNLYIFYFFVFHIKMSSNNYAQKKAEIDQIKKNNLDIVTQYNQAKKKYSIFFEKAIEIEHELSEHK